MEGFFGETSLPPFFFTDPLDNISRCRGRSSLRNPAGFSDSSTVGTVWVSSRIKKKGGNAGAFHAFALQMLECQPQQNQGYGLRSASGSLRRGGRGGLRLPAEVTTLCRKERKGRLERAAQLTPTIPLFRAVEDLSPGSAAGSNQGETVTEGSRQFAQPFS